MSERMTVTMHPASWQGICDMVEEALERRLALLHAAMKEDRLSMQEFATEADASLTPAEELAAQVGAALSADPRLGEWLRRPARGAQ